MKTINEIFKPVHYLLHLSQDLAVSRIPVLIFYRISQLCLIDRFHPIQEIITFYSIIDTIFFVRKLDDTSIILALYISFALNFIICAFLVIYLNKIIQKNKNAQFLLEHILHIVLTHYNYLIYIPTIWITLSIIQFLNYALITLSVINLLITLCISTVIIYFKRNDMFAQKQQVQSVFIQLFIKIIELISCYLTLAYNSNIVTYLMINGIWLIILVQDLLSISIEKFQLYLNVLTITSAFILMSNSGLMELLLYHLFIVGLILTIKEKYLSDILLNSRNSIEQAILQEANLHFSTLNQGARIQLLILKFNHVCTECKSYQQIIHCILRKGIKRNSDNLLFAQFIFQTEPLRALIELLRVDDDTLYYKSVVHTYQQKFNQLKSNNSPEIQLVYNSQNLSEVILKSFKNVIQSEILFWKQSLENQSTFTQYYVLILRLGKQLQSVRVQIEEKYDLKQNQLKNSNQMDIISLRILQIYYSVVFFDFLKIQNIEKEIQDLLKNEKFKQKANIDNATLITNRYLVLQSSLIRKQNQIINPNYQSICQFIDVSQQSSQQFQNIKNFMPNYISEIHDELINNFLVKGKSKLMERGEFSFYQNPEGFIVPCNLHLYPITSNDDFILNLILTRELQLNDYVIFGMTGKIYGITKQFFLSSMEQLVKGTFNRTFSINDMIYKGVLIQYYIPQIYEHIQQLKQQIEQNNAPILNNLTSFWEYPSNHLLFPLTTNHFLNQSLQIQQNPLQYQSYRTKFSSQSHTETVVNEEDQQQNQLLLDGITWSLLDYKLQEQIENLTHSDSMKCKLMINYSITFKTIELEKEKMGYFILQFKDWKIENTYQSNAFSSVGSQKPPQTFENIPEIDDINSENINVNQDLFEEIKMINQINHLSYLNKLENQQLKDQQYLYSISVTRSKFQSYDIENTQRFSKINTDRFHKKQIQLQPLFSKPQLQVKDTNDDNELANAEVDFQDIIQEKREEMEEEQEANGNTRRELQQKVKTFTQSLEKSNEVVNQDHINVIQLKEVMMTLDNFTRPSSTMRQIKLKQMLSICIFLLIIIYIIVDCLSLNDIYITNNKFFKNLDSLISIIEDYGSKYNLLQSIEGQRDGIFNLSLKLQQNIDSTLKGYYVDNFNDYMNKLNYLKELSEPQSTDLFVQIQILDDYLLVLYNQIDKHYIKMDKFFPVFQQLIENSKITSNFDTQFLSKQTILAVIFALFTFILLLFSLKLMYQQKEIIESIVQLIGRTNYQFIKNQIARLSTIQELIDNQNLKNWKLSSYSKIMLNLQNQTQQGTQQMNILEGSIVKLHPIAIYIFILLYMIYFVTGIFLKYQTRDTSYADLSTQFIYLKMNLDITILFGSVIKYSQYQQFINNAVEKYSQQNQQLIIQIFDDSSKNLFQLNSAFMQKIQELNFNDLEEIFSNNLCLHFSDILYMCQQNNKDTPKDDYSILIDQGLLSIVNNIQQQKIVDFSVELNSQLFSNTFNSLETQIQSQLYQNLFVQYYSDLQPVLHEMNQQFLQKVYLSYDLYVFNLTIYDILFGIILMILFGIYILIEKWKQNQQFQEISLCLRLLPYEQSQYRVNLHQIKAISKRF